MLQKRHNPEPALNRIFRGMQRKWRSPPIGSHSSRNNMAKINATMQLGHKSGEVMKGDWAGDTASVINKDMAREFKVQFLTPNISTLSFEARFYLFVEQEWTSRNNNHLKKLIIKAKFDENDANVEDIVYPLRKPQLHGE